MQPHQERVIVEKADLDAKRVALQIFMAGSFFPTLSDADQNRLRRQALHMTDYSNVLGERIEAFTA